MSELSFNASINSLSSGDENGANGDLNSVEENLVMVPAENWVGTNFEVNFPTSLQFCDIITATALTRNMCAYADDLVRRPLPETCDIRKRRRVMSASEQSSMNAGPRIRIPSNINFTDRIASGPNHVKRNDIIDRLRSAPVNYANCSYPAYMGQKQRMTNIQIPPTPECLLRNVSSPENFVFASPDFLNSDSYQPNTHIQNQVDYLFSPEFDHRKIT